MVDPARIQRLLDRLKIELGHLRRLAEFGETLLEDHDRLYSAKHGFVIAIETCIDTAQHVISSEGLRSPDNFADAFAVLAEAGHLPDELLASMQDMARFRNLLIHQYADVDDHRVVEFLGSRLADFDRFRSAVARLVAPPD